jgi:hypothetical protein
MPEREASLQLYADIWNGRADVDDPDRVVTPDYVGHIGSLDRTADRLKADIVAYRGRARDIHFEVLHRFREGEYVATRVVAHATDPGSGAALLARGLNISRWVGGRLAEEWAVWEPLAPVSEGPSDS